MGDFVIFSPSVQHIDMAKRNAIEYGDPVSGGFVKLVDGSLICYGDSFSLKLKAGEDDTVWLNDKLTPN